jgi:hypothetical protein
LWHYVYDANGSLVEVLPNNTEASGAKRYTLRQAQGRLYNTAGYLTQVETHNGAGWDVQAEMAYNGLGQRLSMDAAGVIAYYVMDGNRPLTATTGNDTTSYLYGLGVIGEESNDWSYGLTDGTNTQRQLTDALGEVTYSARYTPWGDTLETYGTGNFTYGHFGGLMDTATGLLYVGDGQYYDPSTGRFLTRSSNPNSPNPYLPFDPTGAIIGPLGVLALFLGRKKKKSKYDILLFVLAFAVVTGVALSACGTGDGGDGNVDPPQSETPPPALPSETPTPGGGSGGNGSPSTPGAPSPQPIPCPTPVIKNWLPELFQITHYVIVLESDPYFSSSYDANIPIWENNQIVYRQHNLAFIVGDATKDVAWSVYVQGSGKTKDGRYIQTDLDPNHIPPGYNAVYQYVSQPLPKCSTYLKEDETMAVSLSILNSPGFECGARYYIEGHGDKVYTITDSGTFPNTKQFDVYAGEQTYSGFYAKYPDTGGFRRVARVQQ